MWWVVGRLRAGILDPVQDDVASGWQDTGASVRASMRAALNDEAVWKTWASAAYKLCLRGARRGMGGLRPVGADA